MDDDDAVDLRFKSNRVLRYAGAKYTCTLSTLKATLQTHGIAVLPDVLTKDEQKAMNDGMWESIEHYTSTMNRPVVRDVPRTYTSFFELMPAHGGLMQHFGWGHRQYVWDVRQNPRVVEPFAEIWGTDDLRTSFDGVNCGIGALMSRPRGVFADKTWLHTDQRFTHLDFECVQAFVTANAIHPGDGTLRVLEGSHLLRPDFLHRFPDLICHDQDWYPFDSEELQWFRARGCADICVTCPAGSMVLWDSRLVHSGIEPWSTTSLSRAAPHLSSELRVARNVVYVCMMPDARVANMNKRRAIFDDTHPTMRLRMTAHWPTRMRLFPALPVAPVRGKDAATHWSFVPTTEMPRLTELGRRLAGL